MKNSGIEKQKTKEQKTGFNTMATKKAVAKTAKKELASIDNIGDEFEEFAGEGFEEVTSDDILIPRIAVLQALSPQIKKSDPAYIEGAEQGMIADLGTSEIYPDGALVLPVYFKKVWIQWGARNSSQGLIAIHENDDILSQCEVNEKRQPIMPDGSYIAETMQMYCLNLSADGRRCFIPFASSQLKVARKWLTTATAEKIKKSNGAKITPPIWYRSYNLTSVEQSNNEGSWSIFKVSSGPAITELGDMMGVDWRSIKKEAIAFRESIIKGEVKADANQMDDRGGSNGESDEDPI